MTPQDFDPKRDLKTELDEEGLGRRVTCMACCQVIFNLGPNPSEPERLKEGKNLALHLELFHNMRAFYGRCRDASCRRFHLSAFEKGKLPPEFEGVGNPPV
jgi:hypothetical protein